MNLSLLGLVATCGLAVLLHHVGLAQPVADVQAEGLVEELNTDRPHFGESPYVLPAGWVQLETGTLFVRERGVNSTVTTFPTLVRAGVGEGVELRLESDVYSMEVGARGLSDVSLGAKWRVFEGSGPEVSLLAKLNIPSGARALRASGVEPELRVLVSQELDEVTELEANVGATLAVDPGTEGRWTQLFYAVNLTRGLNEVVAVYGEIVGTRLDCSVSGQSHYLDAGFLFSLGHDTQLDVEYYRGLSSTGIDWGVGLGFSARWR